MDADKPLSSTENEETLDGAFGGALRLYQPKRGYRFSLDALLLARFAAERKAERIADLGCGCGVVGLGILTLTRAETLVGIDCQHDMVKRCVRSAKLNGLTDRADFIVGDVSRAPETFAPRSFDLVVSNPPFRPAFTGRTCPNPGEAVARQEIRLNLPQLVISASHLLRARGVFCAIYPAERFSQFILECQKLQLTPKVVRFIHPRHDREAKLFLVRCLKEANQGLTVLPPLVLHEGAGQYGPEATALLGAP